MIVTKRIAIFSSGPGTNAENIIRYFQANKKAVVEMVLCNNLDAGVIKRTEKLQIPCILFTKEDFYKSEKIESLLKEKKIELIVLAGFLWLLPQKLIETFPNKIINIHHALLPKHGGKGYYGMNVHRAVLKAGEKTSGITIHYVNENFDEGRIIAQYECAIKENDTPESLAAKIHQLEYEYYPKVIEQLLEK